MNSWQLEQSYIKRWQTIICARTTFGQYRQVYSRILDMWTQTCVALRRFIDELFAHGRSEMVVALAEHILPHVADSC